MPTASERIGGGTSNVKPLRLKDWKMTIAPTGLVAAVAGVRTVTDIQAGGTGTGSGGWRTVIMPTLGLSSIGVEMVQRDAQLARLRE